MKKILVLLLILSLLFTVACGKENNKDDSRDADSSATETSSGKGNGKKDDFVNPLNTYVEFDEVYYDSYTFTLNNDMKGVVLESYTAFLQFSKKNEFPGNGDFDQKFFDENTLLLIPLERASISFELAIKNLYKDADSNLLVTVNDVQTKGGFTGLLRRTLVAKIKKEDLGKVNEIKLNVELQSASEFVIDETPEKVELTTVDHSFDGKIESKFSENFASNGSYHTDSTRVEWLEIAKDVYELAKIAERYTAEDKTEFNNYVASLDENFFKEKMLIAVSCSGDYNNASLGTNLLHVISEPIPELEAPKDVYHSLQLDIVIDESASTAFEPYEKVLVLEVSKKDVPDDLHYYFINYINELGDLNSKLGNVEFTSYINKIETEGNHTNAALTMPSIGSTRCATNTEELEGAKSFVLGNNTLSTDLEELLNGFDGEFFESNAVLITEVYVDKGESVSVEGVRRAVYAEEFFIATDIVINDSVQPSKNEDLDCYVCIAVIDKADVVLFRYACYTTTLK